LVGTLINFVEYDKNPFNEGLNIYYYECNNPKVKTFQEVGYIVRVQREKNRDNPIFHYGKNIYSLFKIKQISKDFELNFVFRDTINLNKENFDNDEIRVLSEMILGTMIINKIMRDPSSLWKISESTRYSIYEIIKFQEEFSIRNQRQKIAIYPGFIIKPSVIKPNRIGFFIDCRTKMFYSNDLSSRDLIKMMEDSRDKYLIDICPNNRCPQMKNPFSLCILSSPRGGRIYVKENKTTSANTFIIQENNNSEELDDVKYIEEDYPNNEEDDWDNRFSYFDIIEEESEFNSINKINVFEYHKNNYSLCPEDKIQHYIDPKKNSIKVSINTKHYDFPPERLRPRVATDRMNRRERTYIMSELILPPYIRLNRIISFLNQSINILKFDDVTLISSNPIFYQKKNPNGKIKTLKRYELNLYKDNSSLIPANELIDSKPFDYDTRNKQNLNIIFIYFGIISVHEYKQLKIYKWEDEIKDFFNFDEVSISNFKQNWQQNKFGKDVINELANYDCIVLIHGNYNKLTDDENKIIKQTYLNKIPIQGLRIQKFIEKLEVNEYNYFRNILLGIYSKCGFIPWKIRKYGNENEKFLGINIKSSQLHNEKLFALSLYSDKGILEKIVYERISSEDFENEFKDSIKKIIHKYNGINPNLKLYFLFLGKSYENERTLITDLMIEKNINFSLYEVYKSSNIRLFDEIKGRIKQVKVGTCFIIPSENEAYFSSIEPKSGTSLPTKIKSISGNNILEDDVQKIFDLTQGYTGYVNFRIKIPLPVYAVERTLNKLKNINFEDNKYECEKPFFI